MEENDRIWGKKVVVDAGDSQNLQPGQIVTARKLRDENSMLKRRDLKPVSVRDAVPATSTQILQGITRAALQTSSFMSAAFSRKRREGTQRSCYQRKGRPSGRYERECYLRSLDSCRYRSARIREDYCRFERRARSYALPTRKRCSIMQLMIR